MLFKSTTQPGRASDIAGTGAGNHLSQAVLTRESAPLEGQEMASAATPRIIPAGRLLGSLCKSSGISRHFSFWKVLSNLQSRREWAKAHITARISAWEARGYFSQSEAQQISAYVRKQELPSYMLDFANHVALTLPFFFLSLATNGPLTVMVVMSPLQWYMIHSLSGVLIRTAYTLKRQFDLRHEKQREVPWIALLWPLAGSFLPAGLGNAAYLAQQLKSPPAERVLARFIFVDFVTAPLQRGALGRYLNSRVFAGVRRAFEASR